MGVGVYVRASVCFRAGALVCYTFCMTLEEPQQPADATPPAAVEPNIEEWMTKTKERNTAQRSLIQSSGMDPVAWIDAYSARFGELFQRDWKRVVALVTEHPDAKYEELEQRFNEAPH